MVTEHKFDHLKDNYNHINELFINGRQGRLIIEPLTVFRPQNTDEWNNLYKYCKESHIKFKLIKGDKYQFVNPGYNDDCFVVDVNAIDTIIDFKKGSLKHLPGTTASQLNNYLEHINPGYQVPLSLELIDPLLMYNQQYPNVNDNLPTFEYCLTEHQIDNRWLIISFESTEALYNLHDEIMLLKAELGNLALSFFYVNQNALLASQNKLPKNRILNSNNILESSILKEHPWFLLIEIPYNKYIVPSIRNMINERLGGFVYWGDGFLKRLKRSLRKDSFGASFLTAEDNSMDYCETLSITIKNDINLLLFAYHAIYRANLSSNFKPHIYIDMLSNEQIKLSVKIYYGEAMTKQEILDYALNIINRIKLKM